MPQLNLTDSELQALGTLVDAAIRAGGWNAAKVAAPLMPKIEAAAQAEPAAVDVSVGLTD